MKKTNMSEKEMNKVAGGAFWDSPSFKKTFGTIATKATGLIGKFTSTKKPAAPIEDKTSEKRTLI